MLILFLTLLLKGIFNETCHRLYHLNQTVHVDRLDIIACFIWERWAKMSILVGLTMQISCRVPIKCRCLDSMP